VSNKISQTVTDLFYIEVQNTSIIYAE